MSRRAGHVVRLSISLVLSAAGISWVLYQTEWSGIYALLLHSKPMYLIVALMGLASGYAVRCLRWMIMLRGLGVRIEYGRTSGIYLGSIALNNVLPLRAGDIWRIAWLSTASPGLVVPVSISVVLERILDAGALAALLVLTLPANHGVPWALVGLLSLCFLFFLVPYAFPPFVQKVVSYLERSGRRSTANAINERTESLVTALRVLQNLRWMTLLLLLTGLVWGGEAIAFEGASLSLGHAWSIASLGAIVSGATLSTMIPAAPGYVGTFHAAFTWLAVQMGCTATEGAALAVITHLTIWLPTTAIGFLLMSYGSSTSTSESNQSWQAENQ